jgi:D-sedoheptulose 7-phosphate isomerase
MSNKLNKIFISYKNALERHRATFGIVEQYQGQAILWLEKVQQCFEQGGKVVWMGNGGSAADAQHLATEFMVRYKQDRAPLASLALNTNASILTAHSNDYEFSTVFERQIRAIVKPQDVVVGLTTSGNSTNISLGIQAANALGAYTVALTGGDGGQVAGIAKLSIIVRSNETARIQEVHMFLGHWLCEALDLIYISQPAV